MKNAEIVNLWANNQKYDLHNVNWFMMPSGDLTISIKEWKYNIPCQDELGYTVLAGRKIIILII